MLSEVLEQHQIFRSWEAAFHQDQVESKTHPGLPGQDAKYAELEASIKATLETPSDQCYRAKGHFTPLPEQASLPKGVMREVQVEWQDAA